MPKLLTVLKMYNSLTPKDQAVVECVLITLYDKQRELSDLLNNWKKILEKEQ